MVDGRIEGELQITTYILRVFSVVQMYTNSTILMLSNNSTEMNKQKETFSYCDVIELNWIDRMYTLHDIVLPPK